ncbi:unnamed protein product [Rotaria socialis]|uniref:CCHC-type domain-containing protein n=1 Tax=Rotaria socialis TaxID=392032 RepID=A0A818RRF6_9BILA|nr:unnamed protein product [Rotaria socialis]CAF3323365.1 unnamed protein product [Rotaria socialis]CAF3364916.1 unnamed protein product [Rotaria socialis]CAF3440505.1 unnamed protein product [Rotaria socialis]CAF3658065.1 unnamed protein product [Rotaria socialis]
MSYHTYNQYERMSSKEKDVICDSNDVIITGKSRENVPDKEYIENDLQQNDLNINNITKHPFKRQLTSSSYIGDNVPNEDDNDNDKFILVGMQNKRKQRRVGEKTNKENNDDDLLIIDQNTATTTNINVNNGRMFINSKNKSYNNMNRNENFNNQQMNHSYNRNTQEDKYKNKNKKYDMSNDSYNQDQNISEIQNVKLSDELDKNPRIRTKEKGNLDIHISQHALLYAVENNFPPIKLGCQPKINLNQQGNDIIKGLFASIENNFRLKNKNYHHPLGFDYWYLDKNGDLTCYTKHTELFVYLCDSQNIPTQISNTNITPSRPRHLPAQHSIVLKFVPNYITNEEIEIEIKTSVKSVFNIEEMKGSRTEKSRHVRLEITSIDDYNLIINNGGITINGHLIEAHEFLSPPRLLICSKCNEPGHIRRNCHFQYDACRRCGKDRSIGEHKECNVCCHRCNQNHLSTDYKCPFLVDYRRSLIFKLKDQPNLLPPNVNIFIPTECRERGVKNNQILSNPSFKLNNNSTNLKNTSKFNISSHAWPTLSNITGDGIDTQINDESVWNELKLKQIELNKTNDELNLKVQLLKTKYDDHMKKMNSILLIISQQVKIQNESIERCYTTINEILPIISSTFEVFQQLFTNPGMLNKTESNRNENQNIMNHISQSLEFIKNRNDLLTNNQTVLNSLVDQQNALMIQGINNLISNNEQ